MAILHTYSTDHLRDGVLSTAKFTIEPMGDGSAVTLTTNETFVGHIVQIGCTFSGTNDNSFLLTLTDATNSMQLFTDSTMTGAVLPNAINAGSGAFIRGTLKVDADNLNTDTATVVVYYVKM